MSKQSPTIQQLIDTAEGELAALQEQVRFQMWHIGRLRASLGTETNGAPAQKSANPVGRPKRMATLSDLDNPSMADHVLEVLRREKKPLRVIEITGRVEALGVTTTAKKGLAPSIGTALQRRRDIFVKKGHGVYGLREWDKANRDAHKTESGA